MICHICGSEMHLVDTDLPFKVTDKSIAILKGLPVLQCENCREYLIEDSVMERVDAMLLTVTGDVELEVLRYAA